MRTHPFTATYRGEPAHSTVSANYEPGHAYSIRLSKGDDLIAAVTVSPASRTDLPAIIYLDLAEFFRSWDSPELQVLQSKVQKAKDPPAYATRVVLPGPYFYLEELCSYPGHWQLLSGFRIHETVCGLSPELRFNLYDREQLIGLTRAKVNQTVYYWVREDAERIETYCRQRWPQFQYCIREYHAPTSPDAPDPTPM